MGRQLFRTQYKQIVSPGDSDHVLAGMPIPAGGMLANVWGDVHMVPATNLTKIRACVYAFAGFIVPYFDDTKSITFESLWNQQVPKDDALSVTAGVVNLDMQPESADATAMFEPGQANLNRLFNVGNQAERIYNRERLLSVASRGQPEFVASSEVDLWQPSDHFNVRIRNNYRVQQPSYVLFAVSNPPLDDMTTSAEVTLNSSEEAILNNLELAIELAMPSIVGLTEAGAESPFLELAEFIEKMVEPITEEETAESFADITWTVFARFTFEVQMGAQAKDGPISG